MSSYVVRDRHYHEAKKLEVAGRQIASEQAAKQAEYDHRANRRRDDDEMLAMCGLPPRRR